MGLFGGGKKSPQPEPKPVVVQQAPKKDKKVGGGYFIDGSALSTGGGDARSTFLGGVN